MTILAANCRTTCSRGAFDLAENLARQTLYRFAAAALVDPQSGSWEQLSEPRSQRLVRSAATLIRQLKSAIADPLSPGERPLKDLHPAAVFSRLPGSAAELNGEYERTFGLLSVGPCPACETEYIHGKFTFQRSQDMADVSGFYAAFGLARSNLYFERHDHIAIELEFMARLLNLERQAEESRDVNSTERAEICRQAEARFLEEHLAWWAPAFARLLARETSDGFYAAVGNFLAALIPAERALLGVRANQDFARPMSIERPEECEGCSISQAAIGVGT
jgi:TorA maturation chaperone TorD